MQLMIAEIAIGLELSAPWSLFFSQHLLYVPACVVKATHPSVLAHSSLQACTVVKAMFLISPPGRSIPFFKQKSSEIQK